MRNTNEEYEVYQKRIQTEFFDKYPMLFPNGHPRCGFSSDYGWWSLLTDLFDDLMQIVEKSTLPMEDKKFQVEQVKEKFGGLRVYLEAVHEEISDHVFERVRKAESLSYETCEQCGKPGREGGIGWIKTLCDDCQTEMEKFAAQGNVLSDRARKALITKMGLLKWLETPRQERDRLIKEEWDRIQAKNQKPS